MSTLRINVESDEEMFRKRFRPGVRIELVSCLKASEGEVPPETRGTIKGYDDDGKILVSWDNGIEAHVIPNVDRFKQLNIDAKIQEAQDKQMARLKGKAKQKSKVKQNTVDNDKEY